MKKEEKIYELLRKNYGEVKPFLRFSNPLESIVSTILSAQCTDERVNIVTKDLFKKYKKPEDYLNASNEELENDIRSTGFFKNKTKTIKNLCKIIIEKYNGKVPPSMEELTKIPGIGRKTANVVLSQAFGIIEGVIVDTHVLRVSQRLGLSKNKDPEKVEQDLMKKYKRDNWYQLSMVLILHGRRICNARKPKCKECFLSELCEFYKK